MNAEQNYHSDPKYDPNRLVRRELAQGMKGEGLGDKVLSIFSSRARARVKPRTPMVDWLQTKLAARGARNR